MNRFKHIIFGVLIVSIWLPFAQMIFQVLDLGGLKGAFVPHTKPKLTDSTWLSGDFQKAYETYLNDTIGFHQYFVRLRNQIDYGLFNKCHSYDIEVGKNGYLIATSHLDFHLGKNYMRTSRIDSLVSMLKDVNDAFSKLNKTLLVVFAPSRGAFYKELAPSWYDITAQHESDYQRYIRLLSGSKVNHIDFNRSFLLEKNKSKYPLFTKCGIHWSLYGAAMAADSMVKFIEKVRNEDLPDISVARIKESFTARGSDADLNSTLNLLWPVRNNKMAYPKFAFNKKDKKRLKLLTIGDSFYYTLLESKIPDEVFAEQSFWYYNTSITSNGPSASKKTSEINFMEEVNRHDVVVLIGTEITIGSLGWSFIDHAWTKYCSFNARLEYYINLIKNDPAWFEQVKQKADQYNKGLDIQLEQDANWWVQQEKLNKKN